MVSAHQGVPISRSMAGTQNFHLFGLVTFSEIAGLKDWYCPAMLWPSNLKCFRIGSMQEWEPYEADMAVPMTASDLSLKARFP